MKLRFDSLDDETGLEILDTVENNRLVLYTPESVSPSDADTGEFEFPVASAREIRTDEIVMPNTLPITLRDAEGNPLSQVGHDDAARHPRGDYLVEFNVSPKLYFRFESAFRVDTNPDRMRFEFDTTTSVRVGARSKHTSPAETITVPDDPEALMDVVSTFGSALKTTSPERAWPSLRGHPPRIERGDDLRIPDGLEPPETGVTIRVPADYEHVLPVAPLAYYLAATVRPGDTPRLTTDSGFTYRFDTGRGFEDEVIRTFKRVFTLDCAARTEGFYLKRLHEREQLDARPDCSLDFADLYDRPLAERLESYLSVPYSSLTDAIPKWDRTVHTRPTPDAAEVLPYVVNDLSLVRVRSSEPSAPSRSREPRERAALDAFKRGNELETSPSGEENARGIPDTGEYVPVPDGHDTVEQAWFGDGTPVHGTKLLREAFERDPPEPTDGLIDVTVVCNDERMREEWTTVSEVYGTRDLLPFEVDCRFGVETDDLRDLLASEMDLFHFIGHIDGRGFECPDGVLDAHTVDEAGATAVLLNACRSHDQGVALVSAGAGAAVVSLGDVDNHGAGEVGETFARLLNHGFDVGSAVTLTEEFTSIGRHYVAVGDPGVRLARPEHGSPVIWKLGDRPPVPWDPDERLTVKAFYYAIRSLSMGASVRPYVQPNDEAEEYLLPGKTGPFDVTGAELDRMLGDDEALFAVDGRLCWYDGGEFGDRWDER